MYAIDRDRTHYTSCGFASCITPATTYAPWKVNGYVQEMRSACDEHKNGTDTIVTESELRAMWGDR